VLCKQDNSVSLLLTLALLFNFCPPKNVQPEHLEALKLTACSKSFRTWQYGAQPCIPQYVLV